MANPSLQQTGTYPLYLGPTLLFDLLNADLTSTIAQKFTKRYTGSAYFVTDIVARSRTGTATAGTAGGISDGTNQFVATSQSWASLASGILVHPTLGSITNVATATPSLTLTTGSTNTTSFTGVIGFTASSCSFTGAVAGAGTITVGGTITGTVSVGSTGTLQTLTGTGISSGTVIVGAGSGTGGAGTYICNNFFASTQAGIAVSGLGCTLTTTSVTGTIAIGQYVHGVGVPQFAQILNQVSGVAGGAGVYTLSTNVQVQVASESMNSSNITADYYIYGYDIT